MYPQQRNESSSRQAQSPRTLNNHNQVSFFPVAPYVISTSTREKRWTSNVSSCIVKAFEISKPSEKLCSDLLQALSEDPRFTVRTTEHRGPLAIDWHVPGYWILSSLEDSWVKLFEFGCFVMEIDVPRDELLV